LQRGKVNDCECGKSYDRSHDRGGKSLDSDGEVDKKGSGILEIPMFGAPTGRRRDASVFNSKHSRDCESRSVYGSKHFVGNEQGSGSPSFHVQLLTRRTLQKHLRVGAGDVRIARAGGRDDTRLSTLPPARLFILNYTVGLSWRTREIQGLQLTRREQCSARVWDRVAHVRTD
jgi:hypothetical protein